MSLFGSIMSKIFHHGGGADGATTSQHPAPSSTDAPAQSNPAAAPGGSPAAASAQAQAPVAPAQPVDVGQVLEGMAAQKGGGGNWRTSIVDLLKLLDLDSSLDARKQLANELNVHVAADGSAQENEALIKAVWAKLAENGGKVPAGLS